MYPVTICKKSLGPGLILRYDQRKEKETCESVLGMLEACITQVPLELQPGNYQDIHQISDLVGVQEVRWDKEGTERAGDYNFFFF